MRIFNKLIFDQMVVGSSGGNYVSYPSDPKWCPLLGLADKLVLTALVDQVSGNGTMSVLVVHAGDNRFYPAGPIVGSASPQLGAMVKKVGGTNVGIAMFSIDDTMTFLEIGTDDGTVPSAAYVGIGVQVGAASATAPVTAHVRIFVTGRVEGEFPTEEEGCGCNKTAPQPRLPATRPGLPLQRITPRSKLPQ